MPSETMSPRERWIAAIKREKPDRVPMDYWGTGEANAKIMAHLGAADMDEVFARLHIDAPLNVGPRYSGPRPPEGEDIWGIRRREVDYGTGKYQEVTHHPLAAFESVEEIEAKYRWPNVDFWDHSRIAAEVEGADHRPVRGGGSEPFNLYCHLRGQEQAMMDLVLEPEIVHYCLDKLFDLAYQTTARTLEAAGGKVLISYVAEDLGSQESLLYSPEQIETFLLPRMKRMMDLVHSAGAYVFTHSDGAVRKAIPGLIGIGMDVLNPIQWRCDGMEREGLKRDFGKSIAFHGGTDNQYTLPFGSLDEVRAEVADNIRILGEGSGYILAPCHNVQAVGPAENIVAMYEAGYENGWM